MAGLALAGLAAALLARKALRGRAPEAGREVAPAAGGDLESAVEWISVRLPEEVGSILSREDLRRIVNWNFEYFRSRSASGNGHSPGTEGAVVVAGAETVDYVLSRADEEGAVYTPAQVHAVLEAQVSYMETLGAASGGPEGA